MPANRNAPLVKRESLGGAFFLLTFAHDEVAQAGRPGQFVMLKAGDSAEPPLRRPVSLMAVDEREGTFTVFLKALGHETRALTLLAKGETAQCLGPLGRPFTPPGETSIAAFVAGGYGVAPFHFFAQRLERPRETARLFYGGRTARDLALLHPLEGLIPVEPATEDGSLGTKGLVTGPVEAWLDRETRPVRLYACGPARMMHAVAALGQKRGIVTELSLDPFMGCGVGTCLSCVVRTQREDEERWKYRCACTEGPVFDASEVVWPGSEVSRARTSRTSGGGR